MMASHRYTMVCCASLLLACAADHVLAQGGPPASTPAASSSRPAVEQLKARRAQRQRELERARMMRERARAYARGRARSSPRCRLFFSPLNVVVGGGSVLDGSAARGAMVVGADVAYFNYCALAWTVAEARMAFYETCPNGASCAFQGSMFVGSRPGYTLGRGDGRMVLGLGLGWGQIGRGFADRDPEAHGFIVSPSIRYVYRGFVGFDVQTFFPIYPGLGKHYPVALAFNAFLSMGPWR